MSALAVIIAFTAAEAFAAQTILAWDAPTSADGTPAAGLAGYRLHLGASSGSYTQRIDVGNQTIYTLNGLAEGATYYFAVTAYDSAGNESAFSNEVSRTLQTTTAPVPATYTVTTTAGSGGAITASSGFPVNQATNGTDTISTITVSPGTTLSLTINPRNGYQIGDVKLDDISMGKITGYTFNNMTADHRVAAVFAAVPSASLAKGDVDGDGRTSLIDVLSVLRAVVNSAPLSAEQKPIADVWPLDGSGRPLGDGTITLNDALAILRKVAGVAGW
jgi:fibronectin type 3 domain-containing protein